MSFVASLALQVITSTATARQNASTLSFNPLENYSILDSMEISSKESSPEKSDILSTPTVFRSHDDFDNDGDIHEISTDTFSHRQSLSQTSPLMSESKSASTDRRNVHSAPSQRSSSS